MVEKATRNRVTVNPTEIDANYKGKFIIEFQGIDEDGNDIEGNSWSLETPGFVEKVVEWLTVLENQKTNNGE